MPNELEFIIYSTPEEDIRIDAAVKDKPLFTISSIIIAFSSKDF